MTLSPKIFGPLRFFFWSSPLELSGPQLHFSQRGEGAGQGGKLLVLERNCWLAGPPRGQRPKSGGGLCKMHNSHFCAKSKILKFCISCTTYISLHDENFAKSCILNFFMHFVLPILKKNLFGDCTEKLPFYHKSGNSTANIFGQFCIDGFNDADVQVYTDIFVSFFILLFLVFFFILIFIVCYNSHFILVFWKNLNAFFCLWFCLCLLKKFRQKKSQPSWFCTSITRSIPALFLAFRPAPVAGADLVPQTLLWSQGRCSAWGGT